MNKAYDRVLLLVLDGCGAGTAPDASDFGDDPDHPGDTLVHVSRAVGGLAIPELRRLGLGNLLALEGGNPVVEPAGSYARLREKSRGGKDTVTGQSFKRSSRPIPKAFRPTFCKSSPAPSVAP